METLTNTQAAAVGGFVGAMCVGIAIFYILTVIAGWKIFTKAGIAGWKSLIPIYNEYLLFKLSGIKNWFWYVLVASIALGIAAAVAGYNPYDVNVVNNFDYGAHPVFAILSFAVGVFGIVAMAKLANRLAKAFKKGTCFAVGLFFLPNIFQLILAFGEAKYDKKVLKEN